MVPYDVLLPAALALATLFGLWRLLRHLERLSEADWGSRGLKRLDGFNRLFCRRLHGLHGDHIELPASGPALVVANHVSGLDPLLLIAAARRPIRFVIAAEHYRRFGFTWLYRAVGCIPVDRAVRPERAFREALRALRRGEVVALFPHGGIHLDSDPPRPLKSGVVKLAQMARCPIYPVRIDGVRGQGLVLTAVFLRDQVRLRACPVIACEELAGEGCLERVERCIGGRE